MRRAAVMAAVVFACGGLLAAASQEQGTRKSAARPTAAPPRLPALPEAEWTNEHRELVATFVQGARPTNDFRTFLTHPGLVRGVMPFAIYVTTASTLPARHRSMLTLRTAWNARSEYMWARHATDAAQAGLTEDDLGRIAAGPQAPGWDPFEAALLRAADELHYISFISDDTWRSLAMRYSTQQMMDAVFTIAEMTMRSGAVNSLGVELDQHLSRRMPAEAGRRISGPRTHMPLTVPRVPPLDPSAMTAEIRAMLDPSGSGRTVAAVYRTFAQHPALYVPRQMLSEYIRLRNTLTPRVREMLILRIGYLCGSEYEWAAHARAGRAAGLLPGEIQRLARSAGAADRYEGWSDADATIVRAVDELYADDVISERTWKELAAQLDRRQLLDLLITTGGYRMVSMALNSFGVPLEPTGERFPASAAR